MKTEQAEHLRAEITEMLMAWEPDTYQKQADEITTMFIAHAIERLVKAGFEPGGKAVKVIEGMRDE